MSTVHDCVNDGLVVMGMIGSLVVLYAFAPGLKERALACLWAATGGLFVGMLAFCAATFERLGQHDHTAIRDGQLLGACSIVLMLCMFATFCIAAIKYKEKRT